MASVMAFGMFSSVNLCANASAAGNGATFYVATNGSDSADGSFVSPFATIGKAQQAIRDLKNSSGLPDGGVTVYIRGGDYNVTKNPIEFTEEDSGTQNAPIVYKAYGDEKVSIDGGIKIPGTEFQKVTDKDTLERFQSAKAKKNIVYADLNKYFTKEELQKKLKIGDMEYGSFEVGEDVAEMALPGFGVYVEDNAYIPARWPNKSDDGFNVYSTIGDIICPGNSDTPTDGLPVFKYTDNRVENWKSYKDASIFINQGWLAGLTGIETIDTANKTMTLKHKIRSAADKDEEFYYFNVLDELDVPGEYYIDTDSGYLYMYPTEALKNQSVGIGVLGEVWDDAIISFDRASYITLSNLTVELSRASGIHLMSGRNIEIVNCDVRNVGYHGIANDKVPLNMCGNSDWTCRGAGYGFYKDMFPESYGEESEKRYKENAGYNYSILNTTVKNTGAGGIKLSGGDRFTLDPCNHVIENCEVSNTGMFHQFLSAGIQLKGVGFTVRHCAVHNIPAAAMRFGLNDSVIEYNEFYDCVREAYDIGVLYTNNFSACVSAGTEIRYNYFHDVPKTLPNVGHYKDGLSFNEQQKISFKFGVYNDSDTSSLTVHHNLFADMPVALFPGITDNNWKNNIFVNVDKPMWLNLQHIIRGNYYKYGVSLESLSNSEGVNEFWAFKDNEVWLEKHPRVDEIRKFYEAHIEKAWQPVMSTITGNYSIFWDNMSRYSGEFVHSEAKLDYCTVENNIFTKDDPGFANISEKNYRIKSDSELIKANPELAKVDISKMGYNKKYVSQKYATEDCIELETNFEVTAVPTAEITERSSGKAIMASVTLEDDNKRIRIVPYNNEKFDLSKSYIVIVTGITDGTDTISFEKIISFDVLFRDDFESYEDTNAMLQKWFKFVSAGNEQPATEDYAELDTKDGNKRLVLKKELILPNGNDTFLINKDAETLASEFDSYVLSYDTENTRNGQLITTVNNGDKYMPKCGSVIFGQDISSKTAQTRIFVTGAQLWNNGTSTVLSELTNEKKTVTEISDRTGGEKDELRIYYDGMLKWQVPEDKGFKYGGSYGGFGFSSGMRSNSDPSNYVYIDNIRAYKPVWQETEGKEITITDLSVNKSENGISGNVYIKNDKYADLSDSVLIVCAYDKNNRLLGIYELDSPDIKVQTNNSFTYVIKADGEVFSAKSFLWSKTKSMEPLAIPKEKTISK